MAKFNSIHLLSLVACMVFSIKVTHSQVKFSLQAKTYYEKTQDMAEKCIQLCVSTSSLEYPSCNLNTTIRITSTRTIRESKVAFPHPNFFTFKLTNWKDNSRLIITIWKRSTPSNCNTTVASNSTSHGEDSIIIPRLKNLFKRTDITSTKWKLRVYTKLECQTSGCLPPCQARDDSTGHYTCNMGNKKCLTNWFGENCTTFCNITSSTYKCDKNGKKTCFQNWFGTNCLKFCDNSSKTYTCDSTGRKHCVTNYYGENCLTFCNSSASTFSCSKTGEKMCFKNWFGKNCSTFCNTSADNYHCSGNGSKICTQNQFGKLCDTFCNKSAVNYRCNDDGQIKCLPNWFGNDSCNTFCNTSSENYVCTGNGSKICKRNHFGPDCGIFCNITATNYFCDSVGRRTCLSNWFNKKCDQFCDSNAGNYLCDDEGNRVCLLHWYGENCSKYCNNSATQYKCSDGGNKVCTRDWYGPNCMKFCDNSDEKFKCNIDGEKICLRNWYGNDCTKYCNGSAARYKCNDKGDTICSRNWYGPNCSKFCDNSDERFKCKIHGGKICMPNWYGDDCTKFCKNPTHFERMVIRYQCDRNGNKSCAENWFGEECNVNCTSIGNSRLYYCKPLEETKQGHLICPEGWKDTNCLKECKHSEDKDIQEHVRKCRESEDGVRLCFNGTEKDENNCHNILPAQLAAQKGSSMKLSNVQMYGGIFGALFVILILTTIVVVYISIKKKKSTTTSPLYENPKEINQEIFSKKFNRAELTLNVDELMRRRQSSPQEIGIDNEGLMVENPLYDSTHYMRAMVPFKPTPIYANVSAEEVFTMSNTPV